MKEKLSATFQNFSRGIIQPVFFTAVMGIIIALCAFLKSDFMPTFIVEFANLIAGTMTFLVGNMSIIFAIGLATYFAKKSKTEAALLAILTYIMYLKMNNSILQMTGRLVEAENLVATGQKLEWGLQVIDMGVFLGIMLGCIVGYMHNKFSDKELKGLLSPFGGAKYTFVVLVPVILCFSYVTVYVWPIFAIGITSLTKFLANAGALGVFLYDFLLRILIPTGLHHFVWSPILMTSVGGSMELLGTVYEGARPIVWAELANIKSVTAMDTSIRFLHTNISVLFGFIGISLAFIKTAKEEYKEKVKKYVIPACATCVITGLGEPMLFLFIFTAPILAVTDAILTGTFSAIANIIGLRMHISSLIPTITDNLLLGAELTKWPLILVLGPIATFTWYFVFKTLIVKFNLNTPGRSDSFNDMLTNGTKDKKEIKTMVASEIKNEDEILINTIIKGLGGEENIVTVNNCMTRLRVDVKDVGLVDESIISQTNYNGMVINGKNVQIIYGIKARTHKIKMCEILSMEC